MGCPDGLNAAAVRPAQPAAAVRGGRGECAAGGQRVQAVAAGRRTCSAVPSVSSASRRPLAGCGGQGVRGRRPGRRRAGRVTRLCRCPGWWRAGSRSGPGWAGTRPAATRPAAGEDEAAVVATPGGVASRHVLAAGRGGRTAARSCCAWAAEPPITRDRPGPGGGDQRGGQGRRSGGRRPRAAGWPDRAAAARRPAIAAARASSGGQRGRGAVHEDLSACRAASASTDGERGLGGRGARAGVEVQFLAQTCPAWSMTKAMSLCADHRARGQDLRGDRRSRFQTCCELGGSCRSGTASSARRPGVPGGRTPGCRRPGCTAGCRRPRPARPAGRRRRAAGRPARNSCAISGQSVVHTGSRKVSSTTLPRRLARRHRPAVLVGELEGLAGKFSGAVDPSIASARIGSAIGLAWAAAIGAAPRMISPSAPAAATDRMLAVATDRRTRRPAGSASRQPGRRRAGPAAGRFRRARAGTRARAQVPAGGQQRERDHAVGVGAQAAEEADVLDQHPVRQAQHREAR